MKTHQLSVAILFTALVSATTLFAQNYSLKLSLSGSGSGSIFVNGSERTLFPVTYWFVSGTSVELLASPDANCRFDGWTGDYNSSDPALSFTITSYMNLTAKFEDLPGENLTFTTPYGYIYSHPNLRIYVRVINNGNAAATFTRLGYYLSTDATITTDDLYLGDDYVSTLSIGAHSDEEIIVDVSAYPGDWYAGFIIDYWEESIENNENDNIWCSSQFTISLSAPWGPILVSPFDGATNVSIEPRLYWSDGGGGPTDSYLLKVYDEVTASCVFNCTLWNRSINIGPLSYNTLYSWDVRASNSAGSNYSDCWMFTTEIESGVNDQDPMQIVPSENLLLQNYPNPFNPVTTIKYHIPENDKILLKIFDINGEEIQTLVNAIQTSGFHTVIWDGKDKVGRNVSSGVYFYRLQAGSNFEVKKMILID